MTDRHWIASSIPREWLYRATVVALLGCFLLWATSHLDGLAWDRGEGMNLMVAQLVRAGFLPHRDIWSDRPLLLPLSLAGAFDLFGASVRVARTVTLAFVLLGLVSMALITRMVGTRWASLVAMVFLIFSFRFLGLARSATSSLPAVSLGTLALAIAMATHHSGRSNWLLMAGLLLGMSLLMDPIAGLVAIPLGAVLWARAREHAADPWRMLGGDTIRLLLAAGVPLLIACGLFGGSTFVDQLIGMRLPWRQGHPIQPSAQIRSLSESMIADGNGVYWIGIPLALYGAVVSWRERASRESAVMTLWFGATVIAVLTQMPFHTQYLFLLSFPLAGWLMVGLEDVVAQVRLSWGALPERWFSLGIGALVLIALAGGVGHQVTSTLTTAPEGMDPREAEAAAVLRSFCPSGGRRTETAYVISDQGMFVFEGGWLVPPELSVLSDRRVATGNLTAEESIRVTQAYAPCAIVFWDDAATGSSSLSALPDYAGWVSRNYSLAKGWGPDRRVYLEALKRSGDLDAQLGEHLLLSGWALAVQSGNTRAISPGDAVVLALRWQALRPTEVDIHLFVHVGEPRPIAQQDGRPTHWGLEHPTYRWAQGEEIVDTHVITIASDVPPGYYPLAVGMYDAGDGEPLPIRDAEGRALGTRLLLTKLRVGRPHFDIPDISHPREATVGEAIRLLGYDLSSSKAHPGEDVSLALYWHCLAEMPTSYTVFVHLLGSEGRIRAQADALPIGGELPTNEWVSGEVIADVHHLSVPADIPPGVYTVEIGMYDAGTGERLPLMDSGGERLPEDRIPLGEVIVDE